MTASSIATGAFSSVGEIAGRPVVMHFGDIAAEYGALRAGAIVVDRSARGRMRVSGAKAREMITGLVTNDVAALAPGQGLYAAALNPKGKIVADLRILALEDELLLDAAPRAYPGWQAAIRKFVNPRLAPYRDDSERTRDIGVFGIAARRVMTAVTGLAPDALAALAPYAHLPFEVDGQPALVARMPDLVVEGYELFVPADRFDAAWRRAVAAGALPAGLLAWEIARIEAGRPEWGIDIDESTIPQEANLDELHAISYTKGCYVGQEVVARVHFRGHVNRHLRGIAGALREPPPERAALLDATGKQVGEVRSSALSPRLGAIGLAMVRREVEIGAALTALWTGGEAHVEVRALPFPV
jgi:folate-binding protein YgfZ